MLYRPDGQDPSQNLTFTEQGLRSIFACWSSQVPHSCSEGFPEGKYWPIQTEGPRLGFNTMGNLVVCNLNQGNPTLDHLNLMNHHFVNLTIKAYFYQKYFTLRQLYPCSSVVTAYFLDLPQQKKSRFSAD